MTQHTPGPWKVEDRRHAALKNIRVVAGTHEVCCVSDVHQRDDHDPHFSGSREAHRAADAVDAVGLANANLIAAAPDLLVACKELRDALAVAMRTIYERRTVDDFVAAMGKLGIADGVGVRAQEAIKNACGEIPVPRR